MKKLKVGIIGCGTIGTALARALCGPFRSRAVLSFICDRNPVKAAALRQKIKRRIPVTSMDRLIAKSDIVIEAASAEISGKIAAKVMGCSGKQALIMSVGGLPDRPKFRQLANKSAGKIWIPSGALAGVDGLTAARESKIQRVRLVTRKPPGSLRGAPYFQKRDFPRLAGAKPVCVFKGNAREAVKAFPQNINVAAVLALAGVGAQKTRVEIWTSRSTRTNQHEVTVEAKSGQIYSRTQNVPAPGNPKTSALAVYSAIAVLRKIFSPIQL